MRIGVPREKKPGESRVGLTPEVVAALVARNHAVVVERDAGLAVGLTDDAYRAAGARIGDRAAEVFDVDLVVKVKELQAGEYGLPQRGAIVMGFQQFAVEPAYLDAALASGATFIACETIESATIASAPSELPVLAAMSRIAGTLAPQIGAAALMRGLLRATSIASPTPGAGILLGGVEGVAPATVVVIGAGASGGAAARTACAMGANVTVFASSQRRFDALLSSCGRSSCNAQITTAVFDADALRAMLPATHLLIGAVLIPGRTSPCLIDRSMIASMPAGAVFIGIGIDQRGIAETSRMSRIDDPFYVEEGVVHCCIPNLPALVPKSATQAYVAALTPYVTALADYGLAALERDAGLARGVQVHRGSIVDARLAADTRGFIK